MSNEIGGTNAQNNLREINGIVGYYGNASCDGRTPRTYVRLDLCTNTYAIQEPQVKRYTTLGVIRVKMYLNIYFIFFVAVTKDQKW